MEPEQWNQIDAIQRLAIHAGDTIIVTVKQHVSPPEMQQIGMVLRNLFPDGVHILVVGQGDLTFSVAKPAPLIDLWRNMHQN